jgi:hypothetical protein
MPYLKYNPYVWISVKFPRCCCAIIIIVVIMHQGMNLDTAAADAIEYVHRKV